MMNSALLVYCYSGTNAAVLHYGHAGAPNDCKIQDGDMWLVDLLHMIFCEHSHK